MTSNATPIEILYTAVMLIGLGVTIVNAIWAHRRIQDLKRGGQNGALMILRVGARTDQIFVSLTLLCMSIIGAISMATPPNPYVTLNEIISGSLFCASGILLVIKSIGVRRRPSKILHAMQHTGDYVRED